MSCQGGGSASGTLRPRKLIRNEHLKKIRFRQNDFSAVVIFEQEKPNAFAATVLKLPQARKSEFTDPLVRSSPGRLFPRFFVFAARSLDSFCFTY
jgi:hypothetical protein